MKKVGKTTRPFRYGLSQIPYDYTVEVRNRFKGLELIDRVPAELWTEVCDIIVFTLEFSTSKDVKYVSVVIWPSSYITTRRLSTEESVRLSCGVGEVS